MRAHASRLSVSQAASVQLQECQLKPTQVPRWCADALDPGASLVWSAAGACWLAPASGGSPLALVQMILGGGKPLAMQSMLAELPRTMLVSVGSIAHLGATGSGASGSETVGPN